MMKKVLIRIHQVLGTALCLLFVMWFATGFVMLYHNFPKMQEPMHRQALLPLNGVEVDKLCYSLETLPHEIPDSLGLRMLSEGKYVFIYSRGDSSRLYTSDGEIRTRFSTAEVDRYAHRAIHSPILSVDTLWHLDRWIPYDKHKSQMPIYRYNYDDGKDSKLYVSTITGEGIQYTDRSSRFYAWIGAIPHWLYILDLRFYRDAWVAVVVTLSGLGALMCLSGLILGVMAYYKRYRAKRDFRSIYPKGFFRWHHITGFCFGIFAFTFSFSGMMSLQHIPEWLSSVSRPELATAVHKRTLQIAPQDYPLPITALIPESSREQVLRIDYRQWGDKPYYQVLRTDTTLFVDASTPEGKPLNLNNSDIDAWMATYHPNDKYTVSLLKDYDNYYISRKKPLPLPVYFVQVDDADRTTYYINPQTSEQRYFNANSRMRKWTYQALHSFSIKGLVGNSLLWNALMWTAMIGGSIVSVTGVVLAWRYLFGRKRKRK